MEQLANPIYGGEIATRFKIQTASDPKVAATGTYDQVGIINIPSVKKKVKKIDIRPSGTFTRIQRPLADSMPELTFTQQLQNATMLGAGLRTNGLLSYYSFLTGNSTAARQVVGAKCRKMTIEIPRDGVVTAAFEFDALLAAASSTVPAAMDYTGTNNANVFMGRSLLFSNGTDDLHQLIKKVTIEVEHTIERGPASPFNVGTSGSPIYILASDYLKEQMQNVVVTFDLTRPIQFDDVAALCQSLTSFTATIIDPCVAGRQMAIGLPDLSFDLDELGEGDGQSLVNFKAGANANTITLAYTPTA